MLPNLMKIPSSIKTIIPLLAICTLAIAQDPTDNVSPTSLAPPDPSPYPTATIFLPGSLHELPGNGLHLAASVITADVNQTAYAVGCMYAVMNASTPGTHSCGLQSSITVTGGESTLIYTYNPIVTTDNGMPGTSDAPDNPPPPTPTIQQSNANNGGATINCNLSGGTRATAATCTGSSKIAGLGLVGSSTTLASTQIDYATFTVTAGRALLAEASEAAARGEGEGGGGEGGGGEGSGAAAGRFGAASGKVGVGVVVVVGVLGVGWL